MLDSRRQGQSHIPKLTVRVHAKPGHGVIHRTTAMQATDAAAVYPGVLDELIPSAWRHVEQYANRYRPVVVNCAVTHPSTVSRSKTAKPCSEQ